MESESLLDRLMEGSIGSCSCLTKTPELQYHNPTCHFRLHQESGREIRQLRAALEEAIDWLKDTDTEGTRVRLVRWRKVLAGVETPSRSVQRRIAVQRGGGGSKP